MSIPSGTIFPQQPVVDAVDANGVRVSSAVGTVLAQINTGTGTLQGTVALGLSAGRAQYTDLSIVLPGGAVVPVVHTLRFSRAGLPDIISGPITIRPADAVPPPPPSPTATQLVFTAVPATGTMGALLANVTVEARSTLNELATGYIGTITIALGTVVEISPTVRDVTLVVTAAGLTPATSSIIRVTV